MVAADWAELFVLLSGDQLSVPAIVDILGEGNIYHNQDFATDFAESILAEVRRRITPLGDAYPLEVSTDIIIPRPDTPDVAATFCLLLSLGPSYSGWSDQFGGNYTEQGELFEMLSVEALRHWFPTWNITRTGWGGGQKSTSLDELVEQIASVCLEETIKGWQEWLPRMAKDVGLDVAAARPFGGKIGGIPIMMWQCASGANWPTKLATPDTKAWARVISLTHTPLRGFATPFTIPLEDFSYRRNQAHSVLLDRPRLFPDVVESEWLEETTASSITQWADQRIQWLEERYSLEF